MSWMHGLRLPKSTTSLKQGDKRSVYSRQNSETVYEKEECEITSRRGRHSSSHRKYQPFVVDVDGLIGHRDLSDNRLSMSR